MIEEPSEANLTKQESKLSQKETKLFTFSPLDELGINYTKDNEADIAELNKIVGQILNFPSTELAQIHSSAMRLGNYDLEDQNTSKSSSKIPEPSEVVTKCPCCGFTRQIDHIKICTSMDGVKNIGTSTVLYFSAYKHLSILLIILGLAYSIFAIITNLKAAGAQSSNLTAVIDYISISLSAKQLNQTDTNKLYYYIQCWIGLGVVVVWAFVFIALKYFQIKNAIEYDNDTSSISDYSVVIEGMPLDVTQEELQTQLNSYFTSVTEYRKIPEGRKRPFKIVRFNKGVPFYLNANELTDDEMKNIEKELAELKETFIDWLVERQSRPAFSENKEKREESYKRYGELMKKRVEVLAQLQANIKKQLKEKKSDELTTVFVTFETNLAKDLLVDLNQTTIFSRIRGICGDQNKFVLHRGEKLFSVDISQAPEPEDIIWTNIGLNDCSFYGRKFFTFTVTLILLGACFGIVIGLSTKQYELTKTSATDPAARYLSIAISLVIAVVNALLSQVINFLTNFERNYTTTNRQTSLAIKSILAQMVNCILIPVIVAQYIKKDLYNTSGLVDNIFMMSITGSFVGPVLVFFDPLNIFTKVLRCLKSRANSKLSQNQRDHNNLYLGLQFQVGFEYIYLVNLFMFACFFVSLQPICVFFALSGYFLMYWVQKYCIFYRYRRPVPSSDLVNKACYQIVMFGPLLYSLGSLTWANFVPGGVPTTALLPNLIALGISLLIVIFPLNTFIVGCFFSDKVFKCTKYEQMRISFSSEYDRMNPSTQEEAIGEYAKFCQDFEKKMKELSVEKQEELRKKMLLNNQRGQLQQLHQQNSRPVNFGSAFGLQTSHGAITNIMNQQAYNPYAPVPQMSPMQVMPQPGYISNQSSARMMPQQPQPMAYNQPINTMNVNPMGGMYGMNPMGMNPMAMMNPMGMNAMNVNPLSMGFNPLMSVQQPGFNPYGGGFRMW